MSQSTGVRHSKKSDTLRSLRGARAATCSRGNSCARTARPQCCLYFASRRARCTTAVLSNTNELHWNTQPDHDVLQRSFDREYLSFRIGVVKPDAAIYEHAVDDLGVDAAQVLFLDDNQVNVDGARAAGLRSELARGPEQARAALVDHGVLDA